MSKKARVAEFDSRLGCTSYGPAIANAVSCLSTDVIMIIARYTICPEPLPQKVMRSLKSSIRLLDLDVWKCQKARFDPELIDGEWKLSISYPIPDHIVKGCDWGSQIWTWAQYFDDCYRKLPSWRLRELDHEGTKQMLWRAVVLERMQNESRCCSETLKLT